MLIGGTVISTVEFHKNMSLVIFLAKCPLKCKYCHNGELLDGGEETSWLDIKKTIDSSADFIDAVDLSGGEPLVQINAAIQILEYARSLGLKTKIDTSGIYPDKLKKLLDLNLVDYVAMDIKAPFSKYKKIVGSNVGSKVRKSMNLVREYDNVTLEARTTFVPTLLSKKDIKNLVDDIDADIYTIQQFRNRNVLDKSLEDVESPNPAELKKLAESIKPYFDGIIKIKTAEFGEQEV